MADMLLKKVKMTETDPNIRNKNWDEVTKGYSESEAFAEASRCLNCKNQPCVSGCPVNVQIPKFISKVVNGNYAEAYKIIKESNSLPAVCGRVCPQETQCEGKCVRGIKGESVGIGRLERFCADWALTNLEPEAVKTPDNGVKIAVIGAGPAGLTCAGDLAKLGYDVTIFEALHTAGGVMVYGIPEFRLPKAIVKKEIDSIVKSGVKIECNTVVGRIVSVDELFDDGYRAVFIGTGAGLPGFLGIEGENSNGVYSANEFLTRVNLMKAYRDDYDTPMKKINNAVIVGGGNVAMDAARCAKRTGAKTVYVVYRRSGAEMPARIEEVHHAEEEGIIFKLLTNPIKINADEKGNALSVTCIKMELGEPDASGRRSTTAVLDSEFDIEADTVIIAVGTKPNPLIRLTTPGLESDKRGCLVTLEDGITTTRNGIYAGGDAVSGAATVILAMGAGRQAAQAIDNFIRK